MYGGVMQQQHTENLLVSLHSLRTIHNIIHHNLTKTYNSGDSLVVTHLTTNPLVSCLNRAERTGSLVLKILWSYVGVMKL
jgi:hypothetical protein